MFTESNKEQVADLERQKITVKDQLEFETNTKKIIELKTKLTLIEGKSNKDEIISKSFEDGSVMKLFQNTDLVLKNCGQIKDFTSKLTDICKNQENATLNTNGTKKTSQTMLKFT